MLLKKYVEVPASIDTIETIDIQPYLDEVTDMKVLPP